MKAVSPCEMRIFLYLMGFIVAFSDNVGSDVFCGAGLAVWEGCCCVVEGGLSCEPDADCPCCAAAGSAIAVARAKIATWLGNKFRVGFDLI